MSTTATARLGCVLSNTWILPELPRLGLPLVRMRSCGSGQTSLAMFAGKSGPSSTGGALEPPLPDAAPPEPPAIPAPAPPAMPLPAAPAAPPPAAPPARPASVVLAPLAAALPAAGRPLPPAPAAPTPAPEPIAPTPLTPSTDWSPTCAGCPAGAAAPHAAATAAPTPSNVAQPSPIVRGYSGMSTGVRSDIRCSIAGNEIRFQLPNLMTARSDCSQTIAAPDW